MCCVKPMENARKTYVLREDKWKTQGTKQTLRRHLWKTQRKHRFCVETNENAGETQVLRGNLLTRKENIVVALTSRKHGGNKGSAWEPLENVTKTNAVRETH